jgi:endonuclease/exonuclease/phosphatase (EEP) superfamily protein YafD
MPECRSQRTQQVRQIISFFQQNFQNIPVIFGGDFNDTVKSEPIQLLLNFFTDFYTIKQLQAEPNEEKRSLIP